jgi:hypothetical protein
MHEAVHAAAASLHGAFVQPAQRYHHPTIPPNPTRVQGDEPWDDHVELLGKHLQMKKRLISCAMTNSSYVSQPVVFL